MIVNLSVLFSNMGLLVIFLPVSVIIGCIAGLYAWLLQKIKNRYVSYAIPFLIIIAWSLWMAAKDIPGPVLAVVNYGYMLLYYPMIVVPILPLANHFMNPEKRWVPAMIVAASVMLISLFIGGLKGDQLATIPAIPPTYLDTLLKMAVSFISTMAYVAIGYVVLIMIVKIIAQVKKTHGSS
jgi:hypothetical protein